MTLPLHSKNRISSNKKRLIENSSQFIEGWAGVGIIVGICAVTIWNYCKWNTKIMRYNKIKNYPPPLFFGFYSSNSIVSNSSDYDK
jgi:hypothetical protein